MLGAGVHPAGELGDVPLVDSERYRLVGGRDARTDAPHARVRAPRPRRHARRRDRDPRLQRDPLAAPAAARARRRNSPMWFGHDSGLASARVRARALLPAPRRAARVPRPRRLREHDRRRSRRPAISSDYTYVWWDVRLASAARDDRAARDRRAVADRRRRRDRRARSGARAPRGRAAARTPSCSEAIAESSFRASRDGVEATLLDGGELRPVRDRARDCSTRSRRPRGELGGEAALAGHRAHAATRAAAPGASARRSQRGGIEAVLEQLVEEHDAERTRRRSRDARPGPRTDAALPRRAPGDGLGRDRRPLRGRGARPPRAHVLRRGPPLRDRADRRASSRATTYPYEVALDGERRWPLDRRSDFPPSAIRTDRPVADAARSSSDRAASPSRTSRPTRSARTRTTRGREVDALLRARASHDRDRPRRSGRTCCSRSATRSTSTRTRPRRARSSAPAATRAARPARRSLDFEEYTHLYRESWGDPVIRWLFSTVGVAMMFDDHDVHDDWNTSIAWLEEMRAQAVVGDADRGGARLLLGLPAPRQPLAGGARRERAAAAGAEPPDAGPRCCATGRGRADRGSDGSRWSFCRDLGGVRMIVFDSREGRVLGKRRAR